MKAAHPERLAHRHDGELADDGDLSGGLARRQDGSGQVNAPHFDVKWGIRRYHVAPACVHGKRHLKKGEHTVSAR